MLANKLRDWDRSYLTIGGPRCAMKTENISAGVRLDFTKSGSLDVEGSRLLDSSSDTSAEGCTDGSPVVGSGSSSIEASMLVRLSV